jgi:hypothetical protein
MDELPEELRPNAVDFAISASAVLDALGPGAGTFFGILIGTIIPGQRLDRIAGYLVQLSRRCRFLRDLLDLHTERLEGVEARVTTFEAAITSLAHLLTSDQVALFEDGAFAASRATTATRIEHIAEIVARGLDEESEARRSRQFAGLLAQVSDEEVIVLCAFSRGYNRDREWLERHSELLAADRVPTYRDRFSPEAQQAREKAAIRQYRIDHLVTLGLLAIEEQQSVDNLTALAARARGRIPDKIAVTKVRARPSLSTLGQMLLDYAGLSRSAVAEPAAEAPA